MNFNFKPNQIKFTPLGESKSKNTQKKYSESKTQFFLKKGTDNQPYQEEFTQKNAKFLVKNINTEQTNSSQSYNISTEAKSSSLSPKQTPVHQINADELKTKLHDLTKSIAKIEQKLKQLSFENKAQNPSEDVEDKTQANNLYLSKLEQEIDKVSKAQSNGAIKGNSDKLLSKIQTTNLYLSQLEKKMEHLTKLQTASKKSESNPERLNNFQTHTLYLHKIEGKVSDLIHSIEKVI